jgi:hypothetical protein
MRAFRVDTSQVTRVAGQVPATGPQGSATEV